PWRPLSKRPGWRAREFFFRGRRRTRPPPAWRLPRRSDTMAVMASPRWVGRPSRRTTIMIWQRLKHGFHAARQALARPLHREAGGGGGTPAEAEAGTPAPPRAPLPWAPALTVLGV